MRKILCDALDKERWLATRRKYITASEAYSLHVDDLSRPEGKSWPKTRDELVEVKRTGDDQIPDTRFMFYGREYEDRNREVFAKVLGARSRPCHYMVTSSETPRVAATLDGLLAAPKEAREVEDYMVTGKWLNALRQTLYEYGQNGQPVGLLEMKQTEGFFGKQWAEGPPSHYAYQVWVQLAVTGLPWAVIACKIGAADFKAYVIEHPGKEWVAQLRRDATMFWEEVDNG